MKTLTIAACFCAMTIMSRSAPGDKDPSFNGTGQVAFSIQPFGLYGGCGGEAVALAGNGSIVVAGFGTEYPGGFYSAAVVRVLSDGTPDATFGSGGQVLTPVGPASSTALGVALSSSGYVVTGGQTLDAQGFLKDMFLVRYKANGTLDTNFGTGGKVVLDVGGQDVFGALGLQSDGKIVITGSSVVGVERRLTVVRCSSSGSVEVKKQFPFSNPVSGGPSAAHGSALVQDSAGRWIVAGYMTQGASGPPWPTQRMVVLRLNADLSIDSSFAGGSGIFGALGEAKTLALQSDGSVIVGGTTISEDKVAVTRLTPSGALDLTFGNAGSFVYQNSGVILGYRADSVAVQADNKIMMVAQLGGDGKLARLTSNGLLDLTYGTGGIQTLFSARKAILQPNGRLVTAGSDSPGIVISRIMGDPEVPRLSVTLGASNVINGGAAVDFGAQTVGNPVVSRVLTVRNSGTAPLAITGHQITGTHAALWSVSPQMLSNSLGIGSSVSVTLQFTAQGTGPCQAAYQLTTDDPGGSTFELPLTASVVPGVYFLNPLTDVNEEAGTISIPIERSTGVGGATVRVLSSGIHASPIEDFVQIDELVSFADGVTSASVSLTIRPDSLDEGHEFLSLTLSDPKGGISLTSRPSTLVRILDQSDVKKPSITVTSPTGAMTFNSSQSMIIVGTASDDKGLAKVEGSVNGSSFSSASLALDASGTMGNYQFNTSVLPPGVNTVRLRSVDLRGNLSPEVSRVLTVIVKSPLTVNTTGSGTVTKPFPGIDDSKQLGFPYTLAGTPAKGQVFNGWSANFTAGTGLTPSAMELPQITFTHQPGLVLTADFIANPFTPSVIGKFAGLVTASSSAPPGGTLVSNETVGFFTASVLGNGTFSGTLKLDGLVLPLSGTFDNRGTARFTAARATKLSVPRPGKPSLEVSLTLDMTGVSGLLRGTVLIRNRAGGIVAQSDVEAHRAAYSASSKVHVSIAGTAGKAYTLVLKSQIPPASLTIDDVPSGEGFATGTIKVDGTVTLVGRLADHTAWSASGSLSKGDLCPIFTQLYGIGGSFSTLLSIDVTRPDMDITGSNVRWFRPWQNVQWYPWGWPEGISVDVLGAAYAQPALPSLLPVNTSIGNAVMTWSDAYLVSPVTKFVSIHPTTSAVSRAPSSDASFTMSLIPSTGLISGVFSHSDGTKPAWQGVLFQKGIHKGGYGYFMTFSPKVIDGLGRGGRVRLLQR